MAKIALACAIVAASLWDFRADSLRIFDLAALCFLFAFFVLDFDVSRDWLSRRIYILPLIAVVIVYAAVGYLNFHHRSSLAISLLAIVCLQFAGYRDALWISRVFKWIIYLNVAILLVQFFSYYLFGILMDPQQILGGSSRLFSNDQFRPAGLFQEPNSYSLNIFVVATVALLPKRDRALALVAAISMLMSQSLWGIAGAFVLLALNEWNQEVPFLKKCIVGVAVCTAVLVGFSAFVWLAKPAKVDVPWFYVRILHIGKDTSTQDRYGLLADQTASSKARLASKSALVSTMDATRWLGHGLSTRAFVDTIPANGLSFLWYCFRPVGLTLLFGAFGVALSRLTLRDKLYIIGAVAFTFTTYPLITYVIFWIWLPALIMLARQRSKEPQGMAPQPFAAGG